MRDTEERLRVLLNDKAQDMITDAQMPARVARRARGRRLATAGVGALAAVAGVVAIVLAIDAVDARPAPPVASPTVVDPPAVYPSAFVGVTEDRDVVLASTTDGSVVTVLATAAELGGSNLNLDLELAPDGSIAYVGARRSDAEASLYRLFADGHDPVRIAEGYAPAVTEEHGLIAYAGCDADGCGTTLVVASLENLDERTVLNVAPTIEARIHRIEWLADGRLAYSLWPPGDSNPEVRVIDPLTENRPLEDVPAIGPDTFEAGWTPLGAYADPQLLVVASYCCTTAAGDEIERERVLVVDPVSGQARGTLYEGDGLEALDRSGRFLLIVRFDEGGADLGTWALEDDGSLRRIGEGFDQLAW